MQARMEKKQERDEETDFGQYIKPAVGALFGILGGLLLAKGVQKICEKDKK
jgi:hypothetical protein